MNTSLSQETLDAARLLGAATLHEAAGKLGALPSAIKPMDPRWRVAAPAFTVAGPAIDNLWLHRAIYMAPKGAILIHECGGAAEAGYWGGVMTAAAIARGLAAFVTEGGVRDVSELRAMEFPVFAANTCIRGTSKRADGTGSMGTAVRIGDVFVSTGDLVVADADGVVVIPSADALRVIALGAEREKEEREIIDRLRDGERTLDIYRLPELEPREAKWQTS